MMRSLEYREPLFCTYHFMASHGVVAMENPTGVRWFYENCLMLSCGRKFLDGYTSMMLAVDKYGVMANGNLNTYVVHVSFAPEDAVKQAKRMIDAGFYVVFDNVDDYFIEGKSFSGERHFFHDGLILGYDDEKDTLLFAAYDKRWNYGVWESAAAGFAAAVMASVMDGRRPRLLATRAKTDEVKLAIPRVAETLRTYLDGQGFDASSPERGTLAGISVHAAMAKYVEMLMDGQIPYEKMDWRVMRLLWEHKKCMYGCIREIETTLSMTERISSTYQDVVHNANLLRIQYARYHMKRDDAKLPAMIRRLLGIAETERGLLIELTDGLKEKGMLK